MFNDQENKGQAGKEAQEASGEKKDSDKCTAKYEVTG